MIFLLSFSFLGFWSTLVVFELDFVTIDFTPTSRIAEVVFIPAPEEYETEDNEDLTLKTNQNRIRIPFAWQFLVEVEQELRF